MKTALQLVCIILLLSGCSQEKKLLREAANAVERSNYEKAIANYDEILKKNSNSFFGNAGKGVVLSEFMGRHEQALPYLETALKNTPEKTRPVLHSNLGKSYHFVGNFERALFYYSKSQKDNDPTWADYDEFLSKRIADCKYAIEHPRVALPENQNLVNLGNALNSPYPEYTPVMAQNKLYFTSKRQDSQHEKRNRADGKFHEAIYYANRLPDGTFDKPVRYVVSNSEKKGEAILSASPDEKKIFIFKKGKLYESALEDSEHGIQVMDKTINFGYLQNHASLSPDGNTLYFISESERGHGGTDIFVSHKKNDGSWGEPIMLDYTINSEQDEEAPFVNEAGTLFFSSNGHPGYGGFDVYKSSYINGAWTKPENLGQPINSPGDDIYFTLQSNSSKGYFASARPGGYGDLDLYKVHYVSTEVSPCAQDPLLSIDAKRDLDNPMSQLLKLNVPENYRDNIRSYRWQINGQELSETGSQFRHTFTKADNYAIQAQIILYCDTCPNLLARCTSRELIIEAPQIITAAPLQSEDKKNKNKKHYSGTTANVTGTNRKEKNKGFTNASSSIAANDEASKQEDLNLKTTRLQKSSGPSASEQAELNDEDNYLSPEELSGYNWISEPITFAYDKWDLNETAKRLLEKNIEVLRSHPEFIINIIGHTDARGTAAYNQQLSLKRAYAVKLYLQNQGITKRQISLVKGQGESNPLNNCTDDQACEEEKHAVNRRVQIQVRPQVGTLTSKP